MDSAEEISQCRGKRNSYVTNGELKLTQDMCVWFLLKSYWVCRFSPADPWESNGNKKYTWIAQR